MRTELSIDIPCKHCDAVPGEFCFPENNSVHLGRVIRTHSVECFNDSENGGGWVKGTGLTINWQENSSGKNGCTVEEVIGAVLQRIHFYEQGPMKCIENKIAFLYLKDCLDELEKKGANGH